MESTKNRFKKFSMVKVIKAVMKNYCTLFVFTEFFETAWFRFFLFVCKMNHVKKWGKTNTKNPDSDSCLDQL